MKLKKGRSRPPWWADEGILCLFVQRQFFHCQKQKGLSLQCRWGRKVERKKVEGREGERKRKKKEKGRRKLLLLTVWMNGNESLELWIL